MGKVSWKEEESFQERVWRSQKEQLRGNIWGERQGILQPRGGSGVPAALHLGPPMSHPEPNMISHFLLPETHPILGNGSSILAELRAQTLVSSLILLIHQQILLDPPLR